MKRFSLVCGAVAVGLLAAACSSNDDGPTPFAIEPETVARKLEGALGSRIETVADGRSGKPYLYLALDDGKPAIVDMKAPSLAFLAPIGADLGVSSFEKEFGKPTSSVDPTEETAGTLRFAQHVPDTDIPVFDAELLVSTRVDGSVAFVQTSIASGLATLNTAPAVSADAAGRALAHAVKGALAVSPPILGVVAHDPQNPMLAYRATVEAATGTVRGTVDAKTGEVIALESMLFGDRAMGALAPAAASYYTHPVGEHISRTDPHFISGASKPVTFDDQTRTLRASSASCSVNVRAKSVVGPLITIATPPEGPYNPNALLDCDLGDGNDTPGIAVDGQFHVLSSLGAYERRFGAMKLDALGRSLEIVVHDNSKGEANAFFNPGTFSIHFSDGKRGVYELNTPEPDPGPRDPRYPNDRPGFSRPEWFAFTSPATSAKVVAHEIGHAFIWRLTGGLSPFGEAGAIHEGVADVLASQVGIDNGDTTSRFWLFGEDMHYRGLPTRNFYRPSEPTAEGPTAPHFTQMKSTFPTAPDSGNVHFNSTVISQPWLLMAWGGFNEVSKLGVTTEIGFDRATQLYWETVRGTGAWESSIKGFARKMISYQTGKLQQHPTRTDLTGRWVRDAVICAWTAVGVLTPAETKASYGIVCPSSSTLDTTSCANKRDGLYCDSNPKLDGSFIQCERGSIKQGFQCQTGSYCHRKTGSFDSPALTGPDGRGTCFPEPQPL